MPCSNGSDMINERIPGAEPAPKWPEARYEYGKAWEFHYIGLASGYIAIAVYSIVTSTALFIRARNAKYRKSKFMFYFYAVHSLLVVFGVTRACFLFLDPYELTLNYPLVSTRLLFGLGFPLLTSSYSLLHISFLEISRLKLAGNKLTNKTFVIRVIVIHFVVVIVADVTTALERKTVLMLLICMSFFILWGFGISIAILYSGMKVLRQVQSQVNYFASLNDRSGLAGHQNTSSDAPTSTNLDEVESKNQIPNVLPGGEKIENSPGNHSSAWSRYSRLFLNKSRPTRSKKTARITILTAVLAISLCICNIYALVGVFQVFMGMQDNADPWEWWCFQTFFRVNEIALATVMEYAVTPVNLWAELVNQSDVLRRASGTLSTCIRCLRTRAVRLCHSSLLRGRINEMSGGRTEAEDAFESADVTLTRFNAAHEPHSRKSADNIIDIITVSLPSQ